MNLEPKYTLRPFQQEMVDKFTKVNSALCGDDMGLGKTIEGMELDRVKRVRDKRSQRHTLVVTTFSGTDVWTKHYAKFLPAMKVFTIDPKNRTGFINAVRAGRHDVYICHWDIIRMKPVLDALTGGQPGGKIWFHVIADEVHRIKNRKAQVTQAFKKIKTEHKLGLSGTPADNKPNDFWSILNWLYPKDFGSYWRFFKYYVDYEQHPHGYQVVKGIRNAEHLHRIIAPFFIRRRKEEVAKELPEKVPDARWIDIDPGQRRAYNQMAKKMLAWVGEHEDQPVPAPVVVTQLMRLQQFAVSGIEVVKGTKRVRNKYFDPKRPTVPPELIKHVGAFDPKAGRFVGDNWHMRTVPITIYKMVDPSAKLDYLMDMIKDMDLDENPLVVFTQFKRAATLLSERLTRAKISHGVVTGDVSKANRDQIVEKFQGGCLSVFIGTIGSCRESITLTRSSTVVFVDRAWSPSWNRQAEDRLHRIGQENAVQVIDLIAKNTVDLGRLQQYKMKWIWLQKMFGDNTLDYQTELVEEKEGVAA